MTQPTMWNLFPILLSWCICICPEFSLPLSVWHNSGWNGLLLHWRAALCSARQMERNGREAAA